jgi:hypothetical protein
MPDFPIDRDLFQRILERYFQLEAENRAYRSLADFGAAGKPGLRTEYAEAHSVVALHEKEQSAGHRKILRDSLDAQDAAAVHQTLSALFPRQKDRGEE